MLSGPSVASLVERIERLATSAENVAGEMSAVRRWKMSIPVQPDDSDMIVCELAKAAREAASRLAEETREDDLGLSIDMLDADRLRQYAQNLLTYGPDITNWASVQHVVAKLQTLATGIEKAVRDIGVLRQSTPPASPAPTSTRTYTEQQMQHARLQAHADGFMSGRGKALRILGLDPDRQNDDELNALLARISAAERPARTCATCKQHRTSLSCDAGISRPLTISFNEFGCNLHEPAAPRSVVAPEKE